ncbi:lysophospholipid acyltransferase family protein [Paracoccus fistulariae]|uniref:1-acyl-sn-glycerol-3-phosphate acyltransferase n=1 Tax=Paracoccus fistulariae TaxID=658446 RepID=A0ABY7SN48_9RHOB|nr:lysophospholipid acyltransferase family protein [Paracoccus fistulariae]MDB6180348.1 lysophospholipid acyltransferase family protein [Paracoccus fistulariae]WCR08429.1 1-acyl-sn-glycerol-3-phosphate acyltransferase [Paracoccus fistulariae]
MSDGPGIDPGRGEATWRDGAAPPVYRPQGVRDWLRVIRRGLPAVLVLLIGVILILPLRGIERLFYGARRPWSGPHVQITCRLTLLCMGIGWRREGVPMNGPGAVVANHSSWLDILTMNAAMPVFFVSKSEVRSWPGINILTRVTNTHFVVRDPKLARAQADEFAQRVRAGHRLLFFPEGTSSDGRRVLPFKPTLFQGFLDPALPTGLAIQPLTATYLAPEGQDPRFYGWWGDMDLGPHLLSVLAVPKQGQVVIRLLAPVPVRGHSRKTLAAACELAVRDGHQSAIMAA